MNVAGMWLAQLQLAGLSVLHSGTMLLTIVLQVLVS